MPINSKLATEIIKAIERRSANGHTAPNGRTVSYALDLDDAMLAEAIRSQVWRHSVADINEAAKGN